MTWTVCEVCAGLLAKLRQSGRGASCIACRHLDGCGGCRVFVTIGALDAALVSS